MAIYVLRTWRIKPGTWPEFQGAFERRHLAGNGSRPEIIGLWRIIGDGNEVILLPRYDDLAHWERGLGARRRMASTPGCGSAPPKPFPNDKR